VRVIVNIHSKLGADISGWRAKAVQIENKNESELDEVLKSILLREQLSMYDLIIENDRFKDDWVLYVNGICMPDPPDMKTKVKDNVQIHLMIRH
jgi:hypothetical protein